MSAVLFDLNLSRTELEREIDRMMRDFDRIRKRVTGRHQVRGNLPSVVALPSESFLEQGRLEQLFSDGRLTDLSTSSAERRTLEMVSERGEPVRTSRPQAVARLRAPKPSLWQKEDKPLNMILVKKTSGKVAEKVADADVAVTATDNREFLLGPPTVVLPNPPSLHLDSLDITSLTEETLQEWMRQIQSRIERGDLAAIMEAVYWASPQSSTPHAIRQELVRTLYTAAMDVTEVTHLALRLALETHEPFEPIRRLSLDFLIRHFRVFGMYQSEVLETLRLAADTQSESRETVRLIALRFLCQIMGNHPPVRQWLYQVLWLRREPSLMCRMILLETILLWIQERDASERERFEGLYLLQRTLEDGQESFHIRFSMARQMLDSRFAVFPPDVLSYLHQKVFPLCQQILQDGTPGKPGKPGEVDMLPADTFPARPAGQAG